MAGDDKTPSGKPVKETATERQERLAAALRQNLAKRKAQGRARKAAGSGAGAGDSSGDPVPPEVGEN
jgi:hypothetical protein